MIVNVYYRDEETGSVRAGRPYWEAEGGLQCG